MTHYQLKVLLLVQDFIPRQDTPTLKYLHYSKPVDMWLMVLTQHGV